MVVARQIRNIFLALFLSAGFISCDPWFAFSPYEGQLDEIYHGTTAINLELINSLDADDSQPFKIAVLSDSHYHFGKLRDAVWHLNKSNEYAFVIVNGDISENGLNRNSYSFMKSWQS